MTNLVILNGNIGQKPEIHTTRTGTKVTNFRLATSRPILKDGRVLRDNNGYQIRETEWHRIICFAGLAEIVEQHCDKGIKVQVLGRIHYRKWTDSQGIERYNTEIIADKVEFLTYANKANEHEETKTKETGTSVDMDDDIPF